ncbi:MAG: LysM domain-containing protein, partial [Stellaceae bacterium]
MQNRMLRAAAALAVIGFVAGCQAPTPTAVNGGAPDVAAPSPDTPQQAPVATREAQRIVVEHGQSVSRIAAKYGLPRRVIIAANNLTPPYKIKTGQQLLIPGGDTPP